MEYRLINDDSLKALDELEENSIDSIVTDPPYGLTSITKRFGKENSAPAKYGKDGAFQRLSKGFMGKEWDGSGIEYNVELWKKCYRVLKPGGYLLAFGGSRTYHKIANAIEEAGFIIQDMITWLYGSGMPHGLDIGLAIDKKNGVKSKVGGVVNKAKSPFGGDYENNWNEETPKTYEVKIAQNEWKGWNTRLKPSIEPIVMAQKPVEGTIVNNIQKWGVGGLNIDECRVGGGSDTFNRIGRNRNL